MTNPIQINSLEAPLPGIDEQALDRHLEELLASDCLAKAEHSRRLLRYLVERARRGEAPKEVEIAIDVFGRDASFSGSEASQVRVAVRTLRLKLDEFYAGAGRDSAVQFQIPKGAYRLVAHVRHAQHVDTGAAPPAVTMAARSEAPWKWIALAALAGLALVIAGAATLLRPGEPVVRDATLAASPIWRGFIDGDRPLTIVLGDQFMYSQVDVASGRTNMVRDTGINSSEELRAFLASHPAIAAGRGQRYMSMLQKNTAVGMAEVLQLVSHPGRRVQVRVREEMQVREFAGTDIIYIGPLSRLGPLAAQFELQSRYRFDRGSLGILDSRSGLLHRPEGDMDGLHKEYALAARFRSPEGHDILLITPGGRNSGLLMVVQMLTTPESVAELNRRLGEAPEGFELLIELTVNRQTDLTSRLVEAHVTRAPEAR